MKATFAFDGVVTFQYTLSPVTTKGCTVTVGREFKVTLLGAPKRPIDWSASDDEVLEIDDDSGPIARITATAVGDSRIDLKVAGRVIGMLLIDVVPVRPEEPDAFVSTVGKEIPD